MADIAQCARCGEDKPLCNSVRIDGIKQPRYCKDCLVIAMNTGHASYTETYWIMQMYQLDDKESIENINKEVIN